MIKLIKFKKNINKFYIFYLKFIFMIIGVLAVQGNFHDHIKLLNQFCDVKTLEIRYKEQLNDI